MTVTERLMGVGAWSVGFKEETPGHIRDRLMLRNCGRGHIVVTPAWMNLHDLSDSDALKQARYAGIILGRGEEPFTLSGYGMNGWLGDGSIGPSTGGTGTSPLTFAQWADRCTPGDLGVGVRSSISGSWANQFGLEILNNIANGVADRFNAAWRVTTDGKLDFGTYPDLFRQDPVALVVRHREDSGRDFGIRGITGDLGMSRDIEDTVRRVIYRWDNGGTPSDVIQTGGVSALDYPFRGFNGDAMFIDKVIEDTQTTELSAANALSAAQLGRVSGIRSEITLSSSEYDIGRDVSVGDNLYVYDPDRGIYDMTRQVTYRGQVIHPEVIRCVGYTWPIREGMGVWLRRWKRVDAAWVLEWTDLTEYIIPETGETTVEVGAKPRSLR